MARNGYILISTWLAAAGPAHGCICDHRKPMAVCAEPAACPRVHAMMGRKWIWAWVYTTLLLLVLSTPFQVEVVVGSGPVCRITTVIGQELLHQLQQLWIVELRELGPCVLLFVHTYL